jgi:4-hydroxythreonine-4-phosphate dehydrogenase
MGDPAGIGPEIIVKALQEKHLYGLCIPVVAADPDTMRRAVKDIVGADMAVNVLSSAKEAKGRFGVMDVLPLQGVSLAGISLGKVDARCGEAAFRSVETVIRLALAGELDGTVTAPLNKEAMNLAGRHYNGHTEIFATFTGAANYSMMLADGKLRIVHVTTHTALSEVSAKITKERVLAVIRLGNEACKKLGLAAPRIGVAGLNPHAGENGLFGREEIESITPAITKAKAEGIDAGGPYSPDTVFCKAAGGGFDLVVAMYHDQGHIPLKMLSFKYDDAAKTWSGMTGVNITLGLPIVRASVDHGTAFENAGKNVAEPRSMIHAVEYGAALAATPDNTLISTHSRLRPGG